jgi:hypothetical protein
VTLCTLQHFASQSLAVFYLLGESASGKARNLNPSVNDEQMMQSVESCGNRQFVESLHSTPSFSSVSSLYLFKYYCSTVYCRKMFRMDKHSFLRLHSQVEVLLHENWTARSAQMAKVSSISHVESLLHFACTLRWLAGGSPWDICYAFHVSYSTLHANKYKVVDAINHALRSNIIFPTTEAELQRLVRILSFVFRMHFSS